MRTIFILDADKNKLTVRQREPMTSGSVNICPVRFEFSPDWEGMERVAVFKAGKESRSVLLDASGECEVPWEVLEKPNAPLLAGVYGTRGGEVVLPTIWAGLGTILEGVATGPDAQPPTPDLWEQELARKGDRLGHTPDGELGLYAGDRLLSAVPVQGGGGGVAVGKPGRDGLSAYQIAVENGFEGTEAEWLEFLRGEDGPQGIQGEQGPQGPSGPPGVGVPSGGTTDQILAKKSGADYDTHWVNAPAASNSGGITIEEYDTEDGWHVRKWPDGYIEMAIKQSQNITNFTTVPNVPFKSSYPAFGPVDFPVTLTEKYSEEVVLLKNEPDWSWFIFKTPFDAANVLSKTCGFAVMYGFSNSSNPKYGLVTACTRVTGRWK